MTTSNLCFPAHRNVSSARKEERELQVVVYSAHTDGVPHPSMSAVPKQQES